MKKFNKRVYGIALFMMSILFLSSCSSTPENLALVPKDTKIVATTNLITIAKKGQLTDLSQFNLYKGFGEGITKESKMMSKFMENPFVTGVSYTSDVLMFAVNTEDKGNYMCVSMELSSGDKFTSFLKDLMLEFGMPISVVKKENYKIVSVPGKFALAWDDKKSLLTIAQGYTSNDVEGTIEMLFSLTPEEQITNNKEFDSFYKDRKDINVWMSSNLMDEIPGYGQLGSQIPGYMKDNYVSMNLGFEENQIIMSAGLSPNSNMVKEMKKYNIYGDGFNSDLLKYLPKESYIAMSGSLNPKGYLKMMGDQPQFSMIEGLFKSQMGMDLNKVVESIKGSMLFSIYDFKTNEASSEPIPLMALAFDINGDETMKEMMKKVPAQSYNEAGGYYEMPINATNSAFLIFDGTACLVTNDKSRIDLFKKGGDSSNNMNSSELASNIKKNTMYMYMNANMDSYPSNVQDMISSNGASKSMMKTVNQFMTSVEMKATSDYKAEYIITTGDDGTNSLYKILKTIDDNYMSLMMGF